jgi:hypothetical protein
MFSERGKRLRVQEGYKFRLHKVLSNDVRRWVCTKKTCTAFLKIDKDGVVIQEHLEHNHDAENVSSFSKSNWVSMLL